MDSIVQIAESIARRAHEGQFRRDGVTPYIRHVEAVVSRIRTGDPRHLAIAWLHDVVEDTDVSKDDLRNAGIPEEVIQAVLSLTIRNGESYDDYLTRALANELAIPVKLADLLSNLSDNPTRKQIRKYAAALLRVVPCE